MSNVKRKERAFNVSLTLATGEASFQTRAVCLVYLFSYRFPMFFSRFDLISLSNDTLRYV